MANSIKVHEAKTMLHNSVSETRRKKIKISIDFLEILVLNTLQLVGQKSLSVTFQLPLYHFWIKHLIRFLLKKIEISPIIITVLSMLYSVPFFKT